MCIALHQKPMVHPLTHHCKKKVKTFKTRSLKSKSWLTDRNGKFCKWFSIHSCVLKLACRLQNEAYKNWDYPRKFVWTTSKMVSSSHLPAVKKYYFGYSSKKFLAFLILWLLYLHRFERCFVGYMPQCSQWRTFFLYIFHSEAEEWWRWKMSWIGFNVELY